MRAPSSRKCRLDLAPPWADRFILGVTPSITARYFSAGPSDSTLRWTPCPPEYGKQWLQVRLGGIQLSPSCPFRRLHTFCFLRPARNYPRFWVLRPSFERQRDFNPPGQRAAQHALRILRLGFLQDGDIGVGVFPECEEVLAHLAGSRSPFMPKARASDSVPARLVGSLGVRRLTLFAR